MPGVFDLATMPRLWTDRLTLRGVSPEDDLSALFDLFADPRVARHTDTGPFTTMDDAAEVMVWITRIFEEHRGMRWAITLSTDEGSLIGTCGYNIWHRWNNSAEIGYDLAHRHWGKGLMTEAASAVTRFGFENMGFEPDRGRRDRWQRRLGAVLEKLGFEEEGVLRQRGLWKGDSHDLRLFSLIREDWQT